jgi:hypothetical protein
MKRSVCACLVTAAGLFCATAALAQSSDSTPSATRSISVVGTTPTSSDTAQGGGETAKDTLPKVGEVSKEGSEDANSKPLPSIPPELTRPVEAAKDKSSIVVTPAPGTPAAKDVAAAPATPPLVADDGKQQAGAAPVPPPAASGKDKPGVVLAPTPRAGKDKVIVLPGKPAPPPKLVGHPKTVGVDPGPPAGTPHRRHDHYDHYDQDRLSGDYGRHRAHEDTCEDD